MILLSKIFILFAGSCVTTVQVSGGSNHTISYHRLDKDDLSDEFDVGRRSGRVCTRSWLTCDAPTVVRLAIAATDLSQRSVAVGVDLEIIRRTSSDAPVNFETGFYSTSVDEDTAVGQCVLTVSQRSCDLKNKMFERTFYPNNCPSDICLTSGLKLGLQYTLFNAWIRFCHVGVAQKP